MKSRLFVYDTTNRKINKYAEKIYQIVFGVIKNEELRDLVINELNLQSYKFYEFPASISHHHNYTHGLLEHTYEVITICEQACEVIKSYNEHDVLVAALMHDIGKCYNYCNYDKWAYDTSNYINHIHYAYNLFYKAGYINIANIIASHHGKKEWGSLRELSTAEDYMLHHADMLSANAHLVDFCKEK